MLARDYDISSTIDGLKRSMQRQGQERLRQRLEEERAQAGEKGPPRLSRSVSVPTVVTSAAALESLVQQLNEIKGQASLYDEIEITFVVGDEEA